MEGTAPGPCCSVPAGGDPPGGTHPSPRGRPTRAHRHPSPLVRPRDPGSQAGVGDGSSILSHALGRESRSSFVLTPRKNSFLPRARRKKPVQSSLSPKNLSLNHVKRNFCITSSAYLSEGVFFCFFKAESCFAVGALLAHTSSPAGHCAAPSESKHAT